MTPENANCVISATMEYALDALHGLSKTDLLKLSQLLEELGRIGTMIRCISEESVSDIISWAGGPNNMISPKTMEELEKVGIIRNGQMDDLTRQVLLYWIKIHLRGKSIAA